MDVRAAVDGLPRRYGDALREALTGHDDAALADELGVPPEAVHNVIRLAVAKLAALLDEAPPPQASPEDLRKSG